MIGRHDREQIKAQSYSMPDPYPEATIPAVCCGMRSVLCTNPMLPSQVQEGPLWGSVRRYAVRVLAMNAADVYDEGHSFSGVGECDGLLATNVTS